MLNIEAAHPTPIASVPMLTHVYYGFNAALICLSLSVMLAGSYMFTRVCAVKSMLLVLIRFQIAFTHGSQGVSSCLGIRSTVISYLSREHDTKTVIGVSGKLALRRLLQAAISQSTELQGGALLKACQGGNGGREQNVRRRGPLYESIA